MRLRDLHLRSAPGLPDGLDLRDLAPGLCVVVGPNASGKSTAARAIRCTLWPDRAGAQIIAETSWVAAEDDDLHAHLVYGNVTWAPHPPALPAAEAAPRYRLDLATLIAARRSDGLLAHAIAVELAGGFDLEAARAGLSSNTKPSSKLYRRAVDAEAKLRLADSRADALGDSERKLEGLRKQLEEARKASGDRDAALDALKLAGLRAEIARCDSEIEGLPDGLDRLHEDDVERVEAVGTRIKEAEGKLQAIDRDLEALRTALLDRAFPGSEPEEEDLQAWRRRLSDLEERARAIRGHGERVAVAEAREAAACKLLLAPVATGSPPSAEDLQELENLLGRLSEKRQAAAAAEERHKAWRSSADTEMRTPPSEEADTLKQGIDALRAWLRAAEPPGEIPPLLPRPLLWAGALAGLGLMVAGALVLGLTAAAAGGVLAGAGAALLLAGRGRQGPGGNGLNARAVHARELTTLGLAPESWSDRAVRRKLGDLEQRWALVQLERERVKWRLRAEERAEEARDELDKEERRAQEELRRLGFAGQSVSLPLLQHAHALREILRARADLAGLRGKIGQAEDELREGLEALGDWLDTLGREAPEDLAAAAAALDGVEAQRRDLVERRRDLSGLEREAERIREDLRQAREERVAIYARAGISMGPDAPHLLRERLDLRGRWATLTEEQRRLERRIDEVEHALEDAPPDLLALDAETARGRLDDLETLAAQVEPLIEKVKEIELEVDGAMGGHSLEDARAAVAEARAELAAAREAKIADVMTGLMLDDAERGYRAEHAPRLLQRARDLFSTFTHQGWRLQVDRDGRFSAVDLRQGERRALEQLSDATRIQLLLAARLAAVEEAEGAGPALPLCLDEVLSTSDPERFERVAEVLLDLADRGRQILYFTSDPEEVLAWRRACATLGRPDPAVVELGATPANRAPGPSILVGTPRPPPEVPAPGGLSAEDYARLLGVPPPDPHRPASDWHLIYLLPDRLPDLHRFLRLPLDRIGPWREARRLGVAAHLLGGDVSVVSARANLLEATLEAWRVGRGHRVTWGDVEGSGAVSEVFEERVQRLVAQLGRDPRAFLDAVSKLNHFRKRQLEQLHAHLLTAGALDERAPLDDDTIVLRALKRRSLPLPSAGGEAPGPAPDGAPGSLSLPEAAAYVRWLLEQISGARRSSRQARLPFSE